MSEAQSSSDPASSGSSEVGAFPYIDDPIHNISRRSHPYRKSEIKSWSDVLAISETRTGHRSGQPERFHILAKLRRLEPHRPHFSLDNTKCQTLVFSATLTFVHTQYTRKNGQKGVVLTPEDKLKRLVQAAGIRKERKVIDISQKTTVPTTLVEKRMNCADLLQKVRVESGTYSSTTVRFVLRMLLSPSRYTLLNLILFPISLLKPDPLPTPSSDCFPTFDPLP